MPFLPTRIRLPVHSKPTKSAYATSCTPYDYTISLLLIFHDTCLLNRK